MFDVPVLTAWLRRPVCGIRQVAWGDLLLATGLSVSIALLVGGFVGSPGRHGNLAAVAAVLLTAPVVWRRRAPVAAAGVLAAGALVNGLMIGPMVRCGAALPAIFIVAFALGRTRHDRLAGLALALLMLDAAVESATDPAITPRLLVILVPLTVGFTAAGWWVTSRQQLVGRLQARTEELRRQREETALLAVQANRERIATELEGDLHQRLTELAAVAADRPDPTNPAGAERTFHRIETLGRQTLTRMREVVGTLSPPTPPTAPQPMLQQLSGLLATATATNARLRVEGVPVSLPPGLELTAYRVVEQLLAALADGPPPDVDVTVRFTTAALELTVRGALPAQPLAAALTAARERVSLVGGILTEQNVDGRWQVQVRLPVEQFMPDRDVSPRLWAAFFPVAAVIAFAAASRAGVTGGWATVFTAAPLLLSFPATLVLGRWFAPAVSLPAMLIYAVASEVPQGYLNPFVVVLAVGPWLVGSMLRSRHRLASELEERARELDAERELFARETVRYERNRIARELHDIVAHCISSMVVQAGAGQRLVARDPARAVETFDNIAAAAYQATAEMDRLVELLAPTPPADTTPGLDLVSDLVTRAQQTGLHVTLAVTGTTGRPAGASAVAGYRVVQEALTNVLKHAPGAPVRIAVHEADSSVDIEIVNDRPPTHCAPLHHLGGGYGLRGMRDRLAGCGGTLTAGALPDGGWRVHARLPKGPLGNGLVEPAFPQQRRRIVALQWPHRSRAVPSLPIDDR